ncbi:DUF72 domain-containing protein [uncultured Pedobacter sp.]|uniref:DUF72 domain-containing protein n=1 Tax=uncultured Pedobacter sp. TaxID=246139 RepID=UPI0025F554FA|nr:DUF72 domain-containing protein [uncultured Pedobacter sp.]
MRYFTANFATVELNNSFYRQPRLKNFETWQEQAPAHFTYTVKANRYFTHLKKLNVSKNEIVEFLDACLGLGTKLGPILFQLPPKWGINTERLERFLEMLPDGYHYTFEFRNPSWYHETVFSILKKYHFAFCIYDLGGHQSPITTTADFVYIRLHGPGEKYQGSYSLSALTKWAERCNAWLNEKKDVYVYFDNDQEGCAAFNAIELKKMV